MKLRVKLSTAEQVGFINKQDTSSSDKGPLKPKSKVEETKKQPEDEELEEEEEEEESYYETESSHLSNNFITGVTTKLPAINAEEVKKK